MNLLAMIMITTNDTIRLIINTKDPKPIKTLFLTAAFELVIGTIVSICEGGMTSVAYKINKTCHSNQHLSMENLFIIIP